MDMSTADLMKWCKKIDTTNLNAADWDDQSKKDLDAIKAELHVDGQKDLVAYSCIISA